MFIISVINVSTKSKSKDGGAHIFTEIKNRDRWKEKKNFLKGISFQKFTILNVYRWSIPLIIEDHNDVNDVVLLYLLLLSQYSTPSSVSLVDFKQVNISWAFYKIWCIPNSLSVSFWS